jgi:uncharacterized protein
VEDAEVPEFWRALGIPGLVDVHVHFMPDRVLRKVWAFFDNLGSWPVIYRGDDEERLGQLRALGVRTFPALVYPHRPGMARWLSEWAVEFGHRTPGCLPTATFYPEPDVATYVKDALDAGARIFKAHVQVGDYDPRDPLLDPVWGMLAEAGVPVVTHCGSGPHHGRFTGPSIIGEVLARHPGLAMIVAHMGVPEYAQFLDLADRYANLRLDTTMAFTDYVEATAPYPRELRPRLADLGGRILLGSDFPNIPYPYAHQIEALARLDLGDDWLRAVLHHNGAELFGPG